MAELCHRIEWTWKDVCHILCHYRVYTFYSIVRSECKMIFHMMFPYLFCINVVICSCRIMHTLLLNQSVAKPKTLDISTSLLMASWWFPRLLDPNAFQHKSNNIQKVIKGKPGDWARNRMAREIWVDMSRVLGLATDWFRSDVRVILQYSVNQTGELKLSHTRSTKCRVNEHYKAAFPTLLVAFIRKTVNTLSLILQKANSTAKTLSTEVKEHIIWLFLLPSCCMPSTSWYALWHMPVSSKWSARAFLLHKMHPFYSLMHPIIFYYLFISPPLFKRGDSRLGMDLCGFCLSNITLLS